MEFWLARQASQEKDFHFSAEDENSEGVANTHRMLPSVLMLYVDMASHPPNNAPRKVLLINIPVT